MNYMIGRFEISTLCEECSIKDFTGQNFDNGYPKQVHFETLKKNL